MKGKGSSRRSERVMSNNEQVQVEMETFLQALTSYPERFATDPRITFEEHRSSLAAIPVTHETPADSRRN